MRTAVILVASLAISAPAAAGGFSTARFGAEKGHPANGHPTSIYYNPAGLSLGTGTRLYVEGLFAFRSADYERPQEAVDNVFDGTGNTGATGTPSDQVGVNAGTASLDNFVTSPFAAIVSDLGVENLGVGLGFYVPFGGSAEWDKNDTYEGNEQFPGAVDGVQRWANISGEQRALYGTLGAAYWFPAARLSIGAGVNVVSQSVKTVRARTTVGADDVVSDTGNIVEGRSLLDVSDTTVSVSAGIIAEPIDGLLLGLSYQSQPGFGERALEGTLENKFGTGNAGISDVELLQELPDVFRFGATARVSDIELRLAADYQRWSVYERQCVLDPTMPERACSLNADGSPVSDDAGVILNLPRNFDDTWGVRIGASYWVRPELELLLGVGYDSNAVPDETIDPALMDMDKIISNAQLVWSLPQPNLAVFLGYTNVYYFSREIDPRPRDAMGDPISLEPPSRNPDMAGTYEQLVNLVTLGVQYQL